MPTGNQRTQPNAASNVTSDPLVAPVTAAELQSFMGLPAGQDTSIIDALILSATELFIGRHGIDVSPRSYAYTIDRVPERQPGFTGVSVMSALADWWITLPIGPVVSVDTVTVGGEVVTPDIDLPTRRVCVRGSGKVVIQYTAGAVPGAQIKDGIKFLAAFLYEHRGSCEMGDARRKSGAAIFWSNLPRTLRT